jgi:hypothetical protein
MDLIEGSLAVATFVMIALPGLVYVTVRRWARGEESEDRDFGLSVARGAVFSVSLTGAYMLAFGDTLGRGLAAGVDADTLVVSDARSVAITILVLYVAVPGLVAIALNHRHLTWQPVGRAPWLRYLRSRHGYTSTPSAWDHAARMHQSSWVKVRKPDGTWIGGWYTRGSFASSYPEPRTVYIDQQFEIDGQGNFGAAVVGAGVYVTITDDDIVIWVRPEPDPAKEETPNE